MKVLIVDDERDILDLLQYNLEKEGYEVFRALDGEEAVALAGKEKPELILLDVMMPKLDGIETCRRIRGIQDMTQVYVIFLTARAEEYAELAGFEAGADDYISKPIKPNILLSRIKALKRRVAHEEEINVLRVHDLEIIKDEFLVKRRDKSFTLPKKEFELLFFLASRPGKVFSREKLLENIWGDVYVVDRTIDVHIRKLREKIGEDLIQTVKGVGYKFVSQQ